MKRKVRNAFTLDTRYNSLASGLSCPEGSSKTVQSHKDEADINVIVDRLLKSGSPLPLAPPPTHADFTEARDFRESHQLIVEARESFMRLPAKLRARLDHDPAQFIDFVADPQNLPELRSLGLAIPEAAAVPAPPVA